MADHADGGSCQRAPPVRSLSLRPFDPRLIDTQIWPTLLVKYNNYYITLFISNYIIVMYLSYNDWLCYEFVKCASLQKHFASL